MKINRIIAVFTLLVAFFATSAAASLDGSNYEGICQMKGKPADICLRISFDKTKAVIDMGGILNIEGNYNATTTGNKVALKFKNSTGDFTISLKSDDGGESFTGDITPTNAPNQPLKVWVLKVAKEHVPATQSAAELESIVGSPDGYTSFVQIIISGNVCCVTSEFTFNAADKTFKMTCDNAAMQKYFSSMYGTYRFEGNKLILKNADNKEETMQIYDNGNYLVMPMGTKDGMTLRLILIR